MFSGGAHYLQYTEYTVAVKEFIHFFGKAFALTSLEINCKNVIKLIKLHPIKPELSSSVFEVYNHSFPVITTISSANK